MASALSARHDKFIGAVVAMGAWAVHAAAAGEPAVHAGVCPVVDAVLHVVLQPLRIPCGAEAAAPTTFRKWRSPIALRRRAATGRTLAEQLSKPT